MLVIHAYFRDLDHFQSYADSFNRFRFIIQYDFCPKTTDLFGLGSWQNRYCSFNLVYAYGAINDPCVFVIFADRMQVALEIDACATDVTSLGWVGVGMLTFMLTCVTCTTDVASLGWGGVGMLTFMLTCVTCTTDVTSLGWVGVGMLTFMLTCVTRTTDVTSLGRVSWKMSFAEWLVIRCDWICPTE